MKKHFRGYQLHIALLICLTLVLGVAGVSFGAVHQSVILRNSDGQPIKSGSTEAYSSARTCGACHEYQLIEKHSYHAQIGANELVGFNPFNPDSKNAYLKGVATKGKSWVQSPGHVGKW